MQSSTNNSHSDDASNDEKISHRTKTTKNNSFPKVGTTWHDYELALDDPMRTTPTADKYRLKAACINNVTPSRTDEKMQKRKNGVYWQNKYGGLNMDEEEDEVKPKRQRTSSNKRITRSSSQAVSSKKESSSTSIKQKLNQQYSDDEVEDMKKVEKVIGVRNNNVVRKPTKLSMKNNCCAAPLSTPTTQLGIESLGFVDPSPPFSKQPLCTHCGNRGYACHNKVYSTYCTKACYNYLQNNENHWLAGFDNDTMEQIFITAYNEKRRVELEENHGYYCPNKFGLPMCMRNDSMIHAVSLGDNPQLCKDLDNHNELGRQRWMEAKKKYRS